MRIGLSYDLKDSVKTVTGDQPDDAFEEYDHPATIEYISRALETLGHSIVRLGGGREFLENISKEKVDIVFNIAEGRGIYRSREAQVPAVLEMLNIPYIGSDPVTLAICLDKPLTKKLVSVSGVNTPGWYVISKEADLSEIPWEKFSLPVILKPAYEGSSKGVKQTSLVHEKDRALNMCREMLRVYRQPVMMEEFIAGDEVTVGIVGNTPPVIVGIMRILPSHKLDHFIYSVEVKRDWQNQVSYECPAELKKEVLEKISSASLQVFQVLECRDFARIDFRLGKDGTPYFIEINPLPGLGDYSDLVIMAQKMGWTHSKLIQTIFDVGSKRYR